MLASRGQFFRRNSLEDATERHERAGKLQSVDSINRGNVEKIIGQHLLAEFRVPEDFVTTPEILEKVIYEAAQKARATVLEKYFFKTVSGGISGVIVIEESHFIAHYFPADKYLALDIYTCGEKINTNLALEHIQNSLNLTPYDVVSFKRGILAKNLPFSTLKPGLALIKNESTLRFFKQNHESDVKVERKSIATHWVGEFYCSDTRITNDADRILKAFEGALMFAPENSFYYKHDFEPQGATAVILGDGFHVTTHPWPELFENYTPVDLFINTHCKVDPEIIMKRLVDAFKSEKYTMHSFPRGVQSEEKLMPIFHELVLEPEDHRAALRM
jgi:S-adenosylmethionine decarboxylase